MTEIVGAPPLGVVELVRRHGERVAAGDLKAVLADFRPDRTAQLIGSIALPDRLAGSELLRVVHEPDGSVTAVIEYRAESGERTRLRSRWVERPDGWRVQQVRNLPDTPPRLPLPGPEEPDLDAPHWAGLRSGELRIQRCRACAHWIWAPRPICPSCHGFDLDWPAVAPTGTVFSWTRTWQAFAPGMSGHLPFTTVLVELPHAGHRRLLGVLLDGEQAATTGALHPGAPVVAEFEPAATGPESDAGIRPDGPRPVVLRWRLT